MELDLFFIDILNVIQVLLFLIGCYYFGVALFSLTVVKKNGKSNKNHTFALLVAAHNEESVIAQLVESLNGLNYPRDCYEVFVVADNCEDKTAECAKGAGATVWQRFDNSKRGKGYAMEFAFEKLFAMEKQYEYICVFDADNIVKNDFLTHMNNKINEGYCAVQGYLDSKNPTDTWLTFSYSLWYWINNRVNQLSRSNLDIGCRLGGTGFAVQSDLIKKYGWGATCLAEDTEFTLKLALNDIKVGWAHEAVVYDEKPRELSTSMSQRRRWMQGIVDALQRYIGPLVKKGINEKKLFPFHMLLNFWSDSLYSFIVIFFAVIYVVALRDNAPGGIFGALSKMWEQGLNMVMLTVFVWGNLLTVIAGLYSDHKLDRNIIRNSWGFVVYLLSWIPIGVMGILKKNDGEWFHTPHSPKDN